MSTLHGSWIFQTDRSYFFLWGESWRSLTNYSSPDHTAIESHPFNDDQIELLRKLGKEETSLINWKSQVIFLPTQPKKKNFYLPILAEQFNNNEIETKKLSLRPWLVEGIALEIKEISSLFANFTFGIDSQAKHYWGDDLKFWAHIYRSAQVFTNCR
jgi:hypothetical protein